MAGSVGSFEPVVVMDPFGPFADVELKEVKAAETPQQVEMTNVKKTTPEQPKTTKSSRKKKSQKPQEPEDNTCRICFQADTRTKRVCNCNSKVHIACLNKWRHQRARNAYAIPIVNNFSGVNTCEVCLDEYKHHGDDFSLNRNARIKFFFLVLRDILLMITLLSLSYWVFGWYTPILWRNPDPTDLQRLANGVIWTHAIITVVTLIAMCVVNGSSSGGHNGGHSGGHCCFCYCPDCKGCNGGGGGEAMGIIVLIVCVALAVIGIFISMAFIITDIIQKHYMQMRAETYFSPQIVNDDSMV